MARLKIAQFAAADMSIRFLLFDHIKALQQMGHEVVALCAPGQWVESIRAEGITVETLDVARELSPWKDVKSLIALVRIFREHKFDVVHTHTPKAGLLGPIAAKMAGVPIVVHTIHGLLFHDRMSWWRRALFWLPEKITATFSDYLLSQSKEDMEVAVKWKLCSSQKITYLGNGIDLALFSPTPTSDVARRQLRRELSFQPEDIVVGSAGRLVYGKGFAELFEAIEHLIVERKNLRFLIIGPEEIHHSRSVDTSKVKLLIDCGIVRFVGFQRDMATYYSAMDIFALPSHREGIPRVCLEAGAMEIAVIATDIRGCREVIKDGVTGLLVPVRNPTELGRAIAALSDDQVRRVEMGKRARSQVLKQFNQREVLERLRDFYRLLQLSSEAPP